MKHVKIEIGFGTGEAKNRRPIPAVELKCAMTCIEREALARFGGYTLTPTKGGWKNGSGEAVEEPGMTLMIVLDNEDQSANGRAIWFAAYIKGAMDQEAVALTVTPVDFQFV